MHHSICVHPMKKLYKPDEYGRNVEVNYMHWHVVRVFDYPSWITRKWSWYINYWFAKIQLRFPNYYIDHRVAGYWPEDEANPETQKKRQISAAKAQVTKIENIISGRKNELSTQLFQDEENDPILIKANQKLAQKKFNLNQLLID